MGHLLHLGFGVKQAKEENLESNKKQRLMKYIQQNCSRELLLENLP